MAVLYTLCAGLLTFDNGPATYVGNHYFSAWAGFFISFAVFGSVLKEFLGVGHNAAATQANAAEATEGEYYVCVVSSVSYVYFFKTNIAYSIDCTVGGDVEMDKI